MIHYSNRFVPCSSWSWSSSLRPMFLLIMILIVLTHALVIFLIILTHVLRCTRVSACWARWRKRSCMAQPQTPQRPWVVWMRMMKCIHQALRMEQGGGTEIEGSLQMARLLVVTPVACRHRFRREKIGCACSVLVSVSGRWVRVLGSVLLMWGGIGAHTPRSALQGGRSTSVEAAGVC